jgi:hypothetical protein
MSGKYFAKVNFPPFSELYSDHDTKIKDYMETVNVLIYMQKYY